MLGRGVSRAVKRLGDCMCSSFIALLGSRPVAPAAVWGTLLKWLLQQPGTGVVRGSVIARWIPVGVIQKGTMRTLDPMAWEGQKLQNKTKQKEHFSLGQRLEECIQFLIQGELRSYLAKCSKIPMQDDFCRSPERKMI